MDIDGLISFIPPSWLPWIVVFCVGSSVLSAALKLVLGDPRPGDNGWRRFAFGLLAVLDFVAINSETVIAKLKRVRVQNSARDAQEIAEAQRNPTTLNAAIFDQHNVMTLMKDAEDNAMARVEAGEPPDVVEADRFKREMDIRRMSPVERKIEAAEVIAVRASARGTGLRTLLVLAVLSSASQACAASQARSVEPHAAIQLATYAPLKAIKETVEGRARAEWDAINKRATSDAEREQQRAALRESYAVVEGALRALVATYDAYYDAITAAHADGTQVSSAVVLALLSRWQTFLDAARLMGIPVPDLPEEFRNLVGAP